MYGVGAARARSELDPLLVANAKTFFYWGKEGLLSC